jgi:hypothetical protein
MTLDDLAATLAELGVNLSLRLVADAPPGALTPELKAALKAHKPALVARLASADVRDDPKPSAPSQAKGAISWDELARGRFGPTLDPEPDLENAPKGTPAPSIAKPESKGRRKEWSAFAGTPLGRKAMADPTARRALEQFETVMTNVIRQRNPGEASKEIRNGADAMHGLLGDTDKTEIQQEPLREFYRKQLEEIHWHRSMRPCLIVAFAKAMLDPDPSNRAQTFRTAMLS